MGMGVLMIECDFEYNELKSTLFKRSWKSLVNEDKWMHFGVEADVKVLT